MPNPLPRPGWSCKRSRLGTETREEHHSRKGLTKSHLQRFLGCTSEEAKALHPEAGSFVPRNQDTPATSCTITDEVKAVSPQLFTFTNTTQTRAVATRGRTPGLSA